MAYASSSGEQGVYPSSHRKESVMTMATFLPSSVESCRGGHWISSREEEACPSSPQKERVTTMVTFLPSSVESCEGVHALCHHLLEKRGSALLVLGRRG